MAPFQPMATTPKSHRRHVERSASFHGRTTSIGFPETRHMRRPKTQPDLFSGGKKGELSPDVSVTMKVPAKVLVNVTVQRSLGALHVLASTEWTVEDLVAAAVKMYVKEGRRPQLPTMEPSSFGLHYSQFSLECLDPKEKLISLGSRNFFLCPKSLPSSCSKEAEKASKIAIPWLRFIDFLF